MDFAQQWTGVVAGALALAILGALQWSHATRRRRETTPMRRLPPPARDGKAMLALTWDGAKDRKLPPASVAGGTAQPASARGSAPRVHPAGALRCLEDNRALADKVFNTVPAPGTSAGKYLGTALQFRTADASRTPRAGRGTAAPGAARSRIAAAREIPATPRPDPLPLEAFIAQTLTQWQQARQPGRAADYARVVGRLEAMARRYPDDLGLRQSLGICLLESALAQADEFRRAGLLDRSIAALREVCRSRHATVEARIRLGEACHRRALIGAEVDDELLREAEDALRGVPPQDDDAAWQLQRVLRVMPAGYTRERMAERLQQAMDLLASRATSAPAADRWRAALLQAQREHVEATCPNPAGRRLRFRALHAQYVKAMAQESSPEVLGVWAGLLCAMAESVMGNEAIERHREIDATLERLRAVAGESEAYVQAWVRTAIGRAQQQNVAQRVEILARADAMLQPFLARGDEWRLLACRLGLSRAEGMDAEQARVLYQRVVELGRPLTAVPSLMIEALRCVITALLALDEDKDRLVFARCLEVVTEPGDAPSLRLLAENDLRAGDFRRGCLRAEQAWRGGCALPPGLLERWQEGLTAWADTEPDSADLAGNRACLRMARGAMGDSARMARSVR